MSVRVYLKNKATGEITEHFSVDAKEILPRGEHEQVGGLPVAFDAPPVPAPKEPGPPVIVTDPVPRMEHKGAGRYVVFGVDGSLITEKPVSKDDAEALLATLQQGS